MISILRLCQKSDVTEQDIKDVIHDLEGLDREGVGGAFYLHTILPRPHLKVWSFGSWVIYQDKHGNWRYTTRQAAG